MEVTILIWAVALTILAIVGIVWVLDLQARLRRLQRRYEKTFAAGEDEENTSMAAALEKMAARLAETTTRTERLVTRIEQADATMAHAVQGIGLVRFRAFKDTGGDQSFALALADGEGNGIVISALYGRDATRIYAKPIEGWLSPKALGKEEKQALAKALQIIVGQD
jgi:hypothetical protein